MQGGFKRMRAMLGAEVPAAPVRGDQPVAVEPVTHQHLKEITALAASGDNGNNYPDWRRDKSAVNRQPLSHSAALLQEKISALPVNRSYWAIAELLETLPLVVINAETGTGKTTQVPQIACDVVWNQYNKTRVWPGKVVVCLPTRVGAESVYWRIIEEASSEHGCLAALRTGTVHHGSNNAFLMVMTHGYFCKELL